MDYALEILKDELNEICEMQHSLLEATDKITFEKRKTSLQEAIIKVENNVVLADASNRCEHFADQWFRDERGDLKCRCGHKIE